MGNQNKLKHRQIGVMCRRHSVDSPLGCRYARHCQTAVEREHCLPARHAQENLGRCPLKMLTLSADVGALSDRLKAKTGTQCLFPNADFVKSFSLFSTKQYG